MDWLKNMWSYIKNPENFVTWVKSTFPSMADAKYLTNIYYILVILVGLVVLYFFLKLLQFIFRKFIQLFMRIKAFFLKNSKKQLPKEEKNRRFFHWWQRLKEILNPEKEPIEEAFHESAKLLKQAFGANEFMYELPWYLMLGDTNSGKTTLLDGLDIKRPFGLGPNIEPLGLPLNWNYFDYGVVLDVRGDVLYSEDKKASKSKVWSDLLRQLSYHRARRPLDGLVVTISAEDLYGPKKLSALDMRQKAHILYQKIITIQNNLSMRLPVYVVVTKTDIIPGFDAFTQSFSFSKLKNIFGWSAPHGVQQHYSPSWMEDAAQETQAEIDNLKLQTYTMMHRQEQNLDADALFVFAEEIKQVWENITAFNNQLFADSVYKDPHFLRGIYFTGGADSSKKYTANLELFVQTKSLNILFAKDVFIEKIFRERNIGVPSYEIVQSIWRNFTAGKITLLSGLAVSCLLAIFAHYQFRKSKEHFAPVLQNIKTAMKEIKNTRGKGVSLTKDELETYTKHFDHFLTTVTEEIKYWAFFIPPSWFSGYKKDSYSALGAAFDLILVQSVQQQVQQQLNKLLEKPKDVDKLSAQEKTVFDVIDQKLSEKANPIKTKYFQILKDFTDNLVLLEKIATSYNNFFISRKKDDLFTLMKDLFKYDFNDKFKSNFSLYNWSIRTDAYEKLDLKIYKRYIRQNFEKLFDNFVVYGISQNDSLKKVFGLNALLDELSDVDAYGDISLEDFENIFKTIQDVIDISYKTGDLAWVAEDKFNPGESYAEFLETLKRSQLISKKFVESQMARIQSSYAKLKDEISGSYSTLLEASVFNLKGGTFSANKELIDIKNYLDRFSNEVFMTKVEKKGLATKEIPGKLILWDARHLANADKMLSSYYDFMEKGIEDYPHKLRPLLERVAKSQLHENLINILAVAQYTVSSSIETIGTNPEERFKNQARNFSAAWAPLKKVLNELSSVDEIPENVTELNRFVTTQFLKILVALDAIVEKEKHLKIREEKFAWWNGEGNPILLAFKVGDFKSLENILDIHFRRLNKLAKEYAKPSVNLLAADFLPLQTDERMLVRRWSSILEQSLAYEKKQAGNSIEKLVQLYIKDLKDINLASADKLLVKLQASSDESDYFLEQRSNTIKDLLNRVDAISGYKLLEQYNKIVGYFNENIANKFPFSNNSGVQEEVDLVALKGLFKLMDEKPYTLEDYITAFKTRENAPEKYIDFYKNLDVFYRLFKPFVDNKADLPSVSLQIYFHASPQRESSNIQYLQEQEFDFGKGVPFDISDNGKKVVWTYGDPVNVVFKLADGAPTSIFTYSQEETNFNKVNNIQGAFSYEGGWALFKLLAEKGDKREKGVLQFDIPVQENNANTRMRTFIKVMLQSTDSKDPITLTELPRWPIKAPPLSRRNLKAIEVLERPALLNKDIEED